MAGQSSVLVEIIQHPAQKACAAGHAPGPRASLGDVDQAVVERVDALVAEHDRLTTCFFCLIGKATTCALGLDSCPWRDGRRGDFTAVQPKLASEGCPL